MPFAEMLLASIRIGINAPDFWRLSLLEWRNIFAPQSQNFTRADLNKLMQNLKEE